MRLLTKRQKTLHYLERQIKKKLFDWDGVEDPRDERYINWPLEQILNALMTGLILNSRTLVDVEGLSERALGPANDYVPKRIPDTTMGDFLEKLSDDGLRTKLHEQIKAQNRMKQLRPDGLPCGVVTVDGKTLATLEHDACKTGQPRHTDSGMPYWLANAIRMTLSSSISKPAIDQMRIPVHQNDMSACRAAVDDAVKVYGKSNLFEIFDFDAGFTSKENATHIHALNYGYVMGLKANQPELHQEAIRILEPLADKGVFEAVTAWEKRNGSCMRRCLVRTQEMNGYHGWTHLKQVWLVRQETLSSLGKLEIEDRYFLTNEGWARLSPVQILKVVRNHWGIENNVFNSLDMQWLEDSGVWCQRGTAVWALGILRLIAYNVVQFLRCCHLVPKEKRHISTLRIPWREMFELLREVFLLGCLDVSRGNTVALSAR